MERTITLPFNNTKILIFYNLITKKYIGGWIALFDVLGCRVASLFVMLGLKSVG